MVKKYRPGPTQWEPGQKGSWGGKNRGEYTPDPKWEGVGRRYVVTICALCKDSFTGTLEEGQQWFRTHNKGECKPTAVLPKKSKKKGKENLDRSDEEAKANV